MGRNTHQSLFKPIVVSAIVLLAVIGLWAVYDGSEDSDAASVLTITVVAGDGGTATGSGSYALNDTVTLTATPDPGYKFVRWDFQGGPSTVNPQSYVVQEPMLGQSITYTAVFEDDPSSYLEIKVVAESGGTATGSGKYFLNDTVTLKATPKAGYKFVRWDFQGGPSTVNPQSFVVQEPMLGQSITYTAQFGIKTFDVTFKAGTGGTVDRLKMYDVPYGSSIITDGATVYIYGNPTHANPNTGYLFDSWSNVSGTVTANRTITANFITESSTYLKITANAGTGGTVTGSGIYYEGDTVTLTATPDSGYRFVRWDLTGGTSVSNPLSFDVQEPMIGQTVTYTAVFEEIPYLTITAKAGTGGTATGSGKYYLGDTVTLKATPNEKYQFVRWDETGGSSLSNPLSFVVQEAMLGQSVTYTAVFEEIPHLTITAKAGLGGTVTGSGEYYLGDTVTLKATPNVGYIFDKWTFTGGTSTVNPQSFEVKEAMLGQSVIYTASFIKVYTVTFEAGTGGNVSRQTLSNVPTGTSIAVSGSSVTINGTTVTATPTTGYIFDSWSNASGTVTANRTITANFITSASQFLAITVEAGTGGTATGSGSYRLNDTVTLTATPNEGYRFVNWTFNGGTSTTNPYSFVVQEAMLGQSVTYTANFEEIPYLMINVNSSSLGTTTGAGKYYLGETVTLTATPNEGYKFMRWSFAGGSTTANPYSFEVKEAMLGQTIAYTPVFEKTYTVTFEAGTGGSVSRQSITDIPSGSVISVSGNTITINRTTVTATASTGYLFSSWSNASGTVTANRTITANFITESSTYLAISVNAGTGGTATGSGNYALNDTVTLTATPDSGYRFVRWDATGGTSVSNPLSFVVQEPMLGQSVTYTAVFEEIPYLTITVNAGTGGTATGSGKYYLGDTVTLTANANTGYRFVRWDFQGGPSTVNPQSFVVQEPMLGQSITYTAVFQKTYTVTFEAGTGGNVSRHTITNIPFGSSISVSGSSVTINGTTVTATPNTDYAFDSWTNATGYVTANRTITANFIHNSDRFLEITAVAGTGGTVTGSGKYYVGDTVTLTATPSLGYRFVNWTFNGGTSVVNPQSFVVQEAMLGQVVTYTANFEDVSAETLTIIVYSGQNGTATGTGTYYLGDEVTLVATPDTGYKLDKWTFKGGVSYVNPNTFTVQSPMLGQTIEYLASFEKYSRFNIGMGTIGGSVYLEDENGIRSPVITSPSETAYLDVGIGEKVYYHATPNANFEFEGWKSATPTIPTISTDNPYVLTATTGEATSLYASWIGIVGTWYLEPYIDTQGTEITSLEIYEKQKTKVKYSAPYNLTNATITNDSDEVISITAETLASTYLWRLDLDALSPGTSTITIKFSSSGVNYKSELPVTVSERIVTFYRNYSASDTTIVDRIVEEYEGVVKAPPVPTAPTGLKFFGWWNKSNTKALQSFTEWTREREIEDEYYARWENASLGGYFYMNDVSITKLNLNVGEKAKVMVSKSSYITSYDPSIANAPEGKMGMIGEYWYMVVEGISPGTTTMTMTYTENGVNYYNNLRVTVSQSSTMFYQNHDSQDTTVLASLQQTINQPYNLPADPTWNHKFIGWFTERTGGAQVTSSTIATKPVISSLYAHWSDETYTVTFASNDSRYGSLSRTTITGIPYGSTISVAANEVTINGTTVTATPTSGYSLSYWINTTGTITDNRTITAFFEAVTPNPLTVVVNAGTGGTAGGSGTYYLGNDVNLVATPNEGYRFVNWTFTGGTSTVNPYSFQVEEPMLGQTVTYTANFERAYTVTFEVTSGGAVNVQQITGIPYGASIVLSSNKITINGTTVTATPYDGFRFSYWLNAGGKVTEDRTIKASFSHLLYQIKLTASSGGYVDRSYFFDVIYGAKITVDGNTITVQGNSGHAYPNNNQYKFVSWGVADQTEVTRDMTITAYFDEADYLLIAAHAGPGGTATGSGKYYLGDFVTLTATPNTGYEFVRWDLPGGTSEFNPYSFVVQEPMINQYVIYTARFEEKQPESLEVVVVGSEGGTVIGSGKYYLGDTVTLIATPNEGYRFSGWIFDGGGSSRNPYTFSVMDTMLGKTVTYAANFVEDVATVMSVMVNSGTGGMATGSGIYELGDTVTLTATPDPGYKFVRWEFDGGTSVVNPYTFEVQEPMLGRVVTFTAVFTEEPHLTITVNAGTGGTATGSGDYYLGDTVTLTATPNTGYQFVRWDATGGTSVSNPLSFDVQEPMLGQSVTYTAVFQRIYTVTFEAGTGGTVSRQTLPNVPEGSEITVTGDTITINGTTIKATPNSRYYFDSWTNATGTVTADRTITANFSPMPEYTFAVSVYAGEGTVYVENYTTKQTSTTSVTGIQGDVIYFHATPDSGYRLSAWMNDGHDLPGDNPYIYNVTNHGLSLEAVFTELGKFTITLDATTGGSLNVETIVNVPYGTVISVSGNTLTVNGTTVTATPDEGYVFDSWSIGDQIEVTADTEIMANFLPIATNYLTIIAQTEVGGTVTGSGRYYEGDTVTLTATPDEGYRFVKWIFNGGTSTANPNVFEVQTPMLGLTITYTAVFEENSPDRFTIIVEAAEGGTATGSGSYALGETVTISATPDPGYKFVRWEFQGGPSYVNPQSFDVQEPMLGVTITYTATFEEDIEQALTIIVEYEEGGTATGSGSYALGDTVMLVATPEPGYVFSKWTFTGGTSTANPLSYDVQAPMLNQTITYVAHFTPSFIPTLDVWWDNDYINGSVDIGFWIENPKSTKTHVMQIPLMLFDGVEGDLDGTDEFSYSGDMLQIEVSYESMTFKLVGTSLIEPLIVTYKQGTWSQFSLSIDAQAGKVTFNGTKSAGWNWDKDYNLTNYETVFSKEVFDFSSVISSAAIEKIYHADTGTGSNHMRFQVDATTTYLDTYGFVMVDPTLNIYEKFPEYDDLRLNLYSFAVYGDSVTINGHTLQMSGSDVILWITEKDAGGIKKTYEIADESTQGAIQYKTTLTNLYITWTNVNSTTDADRQCSITFVSDNMTIGMGTYNLHDLTISFKGIWYFTTALYEPYQAIEKTYSMDPNNWFNLSADAFLLVAIGMLIIGMVIGNLIFRPSILDYAIVIGAGVVAYILIGGF